MQIDRSCLDRLPALVSEIHDMWFSVDEIEYDRGQSQFSLRFGREKNVRDRCMRVKGVSDCQVKDTEKVGIYDIDYLTVDAKKGIVLIIGCIPIRIALAVVPNFEILIEEK